MHHNVLAPVQRKYIVHGIAACSVFCLDEVPTREAVAACEPLVKLFTLGPEMLD